MKKIIYGLLGFILLLVLVAAGGIYFYGNTAVKSAIEGPGSDIVGAQLSVNRINLSILGGGLGVNGLALRNPAGYSTPDAFKMKDIDVSVDRDSLFTDQILIHSIVLSSPEMTFEKGPGGNNMKVIKENLDKAAKERAPSEQSQSDIRVKIEELVISDARVNYISGPGAEAKIIKIPDTIIKDIGAGSAEGVTVENALNQVVSQLTPVVIQQLARVEGEKYLKDALEDKLGGTSDGIKKGAGKLFDKLK